MNPRHPRRSRRGVVATLTSGLTLLVLATLVPASAQAAACTRIITGANSGVVNVAGKEKVCFVLAVQDGAVNVAPGGGLSVSGSTVVGAITLKSGYTEFDFCDSKTVRGAISATGGKGLVLIGGAGVNALLCPANTIDGAVTLDSNKKGVTLANNTIAGAVTASANLLGTVISGNGIGGALTCTANVPAPTNGGVRNVVGGGRSGQTCASLAF